MSYSFTFFPIIWVSFRTTFHSRKVLQHANIPHIEYCLNDCDVGTSALCDLKNGEGLLNKDTKNHKSATTPCQVINSHRLETLVGILIGEDWPTGHQMCVVRIPMTQPPSYILKRCITTRNPCVTRCWKQMQTIHSAITVREQSSKVWIKKNLGCSC